MVRADCDPLALGQAVAAPAGASVQVQKFRARDQMRLGAAGGEPHDAVAFREDFSALVKLLREGKIHPVVAERLPLAEARHPHELLESAASKGKLVLVP